MRLAISLVRDRESITDDELAVILGLGQPEREGGSISSKRAEAGRLGGRRSAEARLEANGSNRPSKREAKDEANGQAKLGFASGSAEDLTYQDNSGSSSGDPEDQASDPPKPPAEAPKQNPKQTDEANAEADQALRGLVLRVFAAWQEDTGHRGAMLDRKRGKRIAARLREGFTPERLIKAITNRRNDPFLMGRNDAGRTYDDIETLLRDAAQVERLERLTQPQQPRSTRERTSSFQGLHERAQGLAAAGEKS